MTESLQTTDGPLPAPQSPDGIAHHVIEHAVAVQSRILDRLRRWVELESPSGDEAAAIALAAEIGRAFQDAGAVVEYVSAPGWGQHVLARFPGRDPSLPPVVVLGHLDTVHPRGTLESQPFQIVGDRAEGPGIYDMKAGVAVLAEIFDLFRETGTLPTRPVVALITCDEEEGSISSRALIEETARGAEAVLVLEPPLRGGGAKTMRKGVAVYTLRIHGRPSHAGLEPEKGVSAILELAHQLVHISGLAAPERGTTINAGVIGGGTASNVVPAEAWAEIDVRFTSMREFERVDAALRALQAVVAGATLEIEGGCNRPPLERSEGVIRLYERARTIAEELGFDLPEGAAGGGSDGNFTAALGVPTLDGLGVQGDGAHATDEHILIADLPRRTALLGRLLETL